MRFSTTLAIVIACVSLFTLTVAYSDRVLLQDVKTLVLRRGKLTKARRGAPIPQLNQLRGPQADVNEVVCRNEGFDGMDVTWKCTPTYIRPGFSLANAEVSCEGYNNPDDPYILAGSCGLEFEIIRTHGQGGHNPSYSQYSTYQQHTYDGTDYSTTESPTSFFKVVFGIIICVGVFLFLVGACTSSTRDNGGGRSGASGGGGGGGGGYATPRDAPPAYPGTGGPTEGATKYARAGTYTQTQTQTQAESSSSGGSSIGSFLSHPLVTGTLGYMLGRSMAGRSNSSEHVSNFNPTAYNNYGYRSSTPYSSPPTFSGSGFGGGGGGSSGGSYATTRRR